MMKLCSKCNKRPAVVFLAEQNSPTSAPQGLCLVCAKQMGIKPVDDLLKNMNISDEDIEQMSNQFMEIMSENPDELDMGTTPAFPFLNNIFGGFTGDTKEETDASNKTDNESASKESKQKKRRYIDQYCTNLTQRAKEGKFDVIVGREDELYRTIQILSRRTKNNPCLIGEPGVGKTAIAEGLAIKIAEGQAPARLLDKQIMLLDLTALVAGTQFRGQFESRVKGLIEEIKKDGNIILFIDEIHNLVGAGDSAEGSMSAANILKPALSRGEIQVIGATTLKEYRKHIEKDSALERRFQPVVIEENSIEDSIKILLGIKGYYEGYHNVTVDDEIIRKIVVLSERYVCDRYLPDKAIDLLDEACACASLANTAVDELYNVNKKIAECQTKLEQLQSNVDEPNYEQQAKIKTELDKYNNIAQTLYEPASNNNVTENDVAKVIELWTGIPAAKIAESDLQKLASLEDKIKERIIGQDGAAHLVAAAVKRSRVQTTAHRRPASFIFVGPTGVGKTELVKVLSEQLFNTPETLIRFDMSEFMEKHSVSRIIGAPPGYVGYDEAGQLTEKIRRRPYSIVLFDEIEKAHPDVLNILLQILDDGRITDARGKTVNFENTVIVMTTNAGSDRSSTAAGFAISEQTAAESKTQKALEGFLRPEFINRVDEIITFRQLDEQDFVSIARIMLEELKTSLAEKSIALSYSDEALKLIAKASFSRKFGARNMRRYIQKEVEDRLAEQIIADYTHSYSVAKVVVEGESINVLCM